jgi:hypothetical protein
MATIVIEGQPYGLPRYKLGKLRRAAPFIDRINATAGALKTLEGITAVSRETCEVLSIGLQDLDAKFTADYLEEQFGMEDMPALQTCLKEVLEEAGLAKKGEAPALSEPLAEGAASPTSSDELSTSSPAPKSKAEASAE